MWWLIDSSPLWQFVCAAVCCVNCQIGVAADQNWARFRGPNGTGVAVDVAFPAVWNDDDYLWKKTLHGRGHSSPVGWDDQIFVTYGDTETGAVTLLCLDAATGEQRWQRKYSGESYSKHANNSYASATPALDAEHIYFAYSTPTQLRLVALSHDGEDVWQQDLAGFSGNHGFAGSPIVVNDLVCLQCEEASRGYLVGVEATTGDVRWQVDRPAGKESYATPSTTALPSGGRAVISESKTGGITAVDAATGSVVWQFPETFPARCVSSPLVAGDLVISTCGGGGGGKLLVAVQLPQQHGAPPTEWLQLKKNVPYVPCPLANNSLLFLWHDQGRVSCIDLADGSDAKPLWTKRIGGNYFGSPILAGDKIYCVSRDGVAVVLAADRKFALLGENELGAPTHSTPAVHRGRMYLRTDESIACLPELQAN